jgi:hypothetical protein
MLDLLASISITSNIDNRCETGLAIQRFVDVQSRFNLHKEKVKVKLDKPYLHGWLDNSY